MNIRQELKMRKWAQDFADQKASGLSVAAWCKLHDIPTSTFDYRVKQVCNRMSELLDHVPEPVTDDASVSSAAITTVSHVPTPEIVKLELPEPQESVGGITITRNDTVITIPSDSSTEHIRIIMEALMHA